MRAERRLRTRLAVLALLVPGLVPPGAPARAEGVYGTLQIQYQKNDDYLTLLTGANQFRNLRATQEYWVRTLDVHHMDFLRPNLMLESNLRLSEQSYADRGDLTRTPYGALRLVHPYLQVIASHQPAMTRTSLALQSGLNRDSTTARSVTSHNTESIFASHLSVPSWPRVDLTWARRQRDGAASFRDVNNTRNARVQYDRESYSLYAGVNDQQITSQAPGASGSRQQVLTTGGSGHWMPRPALGFNLVYDMSGVRGTAGGIRQPSTISQSANLSGDWRPAPRWVGSTSYQWRRVDFGTPNIAAQTDQEGSALARYLFNRQSSLLTGVGFRTVREDITTVGPSAEMQKYATAMLSSDARVRRNWTMSSSLVHTTNWDPGRAAYSVQTLSGSTRGLLSRRLQADATLQLSANGDTAAVGTRISNAWTVRLQGTPWRSLQVALSLRSLRNGPGLFRPNAVTKGTVWDVTWRPVSALQAVGQYGTTLAEPNGSRNSTTSLTVRFEPAPAWQWYGTWTRSTQTIFISSAGQLSSREVVTGRLQYAPNRRLATSAGLSYNDPGKVQESRRYDLAFTWSFGR